ncbi:MAG TPA: hypothetical protein VF706_06490, partial [Solirubrobacteraceae bacterium]
SRQRRQLAAILPLVPSLVLRHRTLEDALGVGAADPATYAGGAAVGAPVAGAAFEFAGGGLKALAVKVAAAIAAVGASAGVGVSALAPVGGSTPAARVTSAPSQRLIASAGSQRTAALLAGASAAGSPGLGGRRNATKLGAQAPGSAVRPGFAPAQGGEGLGSPAGTPAGGAPRSGADGKARGVSEISPKQDGVRAGKGGAESPRPSKGAEGRLLAGEERARAAEERQRGHEERRRAHEPRERASEERRQAREERKRMREEGGPGQTSRPPKTEEERKLARKRHEERQIEREREAAEEAGSEPAP